MPDRYVKLPHTTNSNSHLLYTVYPVVFCTSCRVLASGPCPNCTVCLMDVWDSLILLIINSYLLPLCSIPSGSLHFILCTCISPLPEPHTMPNKHMRLLPSSSLPSGCLLIFFLFVSLHRAHSPTAQSTQRFFLHYCSCCDIRYLPKLHTVTSGYYSSTRNFQTTQYFHVLLHNKWMQHIFYLFIYFFSFYEKINL